MAGRRASESGFTLVEMMAVLFIMALVSGLVVLNLPDDPPPEEQAVRDLALDLNRASRMALADGRSRLWSVGREGWELSEWSGRDWRLLRAGEWQRPPRMQVENAPVELLEVPAPLVLIEASGQSTPFALEVRNRAGLWEMRGDATGAVEVERGR